LPANEIHDTVPVYTAANNTEPLSLSVVNNNARCNMLHQCKS